MRYSVRHRTLYSYADPVDLAAHMLHLHPREDARQRVLAATVTTKPAATDRTDSIDHFGNRVSRLFVDRPHAALDVLAEAEIEVTPAEPPPADETPPWEAVATQAAGGFRHHAVAEFLYPSPLVPILPACHDYALPSFAADRPILAGLVELNGRIRRDFAYRPGSTTIATPLGEVMARREGVCQDFAHLMISCLRGLGLPARYVSGYLKTYPPAGLPVLRGADQSHAWIAAWLGPDHGWIDLDPTNDLIVADEHVVLAWGRDFSDVSPVRGIILGGGSHTLTVGVELTPV